ncbi:hypothetical protein ACP4OV_000252 [Aristida adscensionis]
MVSGSAPRRSTSPPVAAAAAALLLLLAVLILCGPAACAGEADADPQRRGEVCVEAPGACAATDLQKHAAFFDGNGDGVVSLAETYNAFRALGFGLGISGIGAAFINSGLGPATKPANSTSAKTDIYIEYIHKGIHGSHTGSYDAEGMFVPEKLDEIFSKHGRTVADPLTSSELDEMLRAKREPGNYKGWAGAAGEWKVLYSLAKDQKGLLHKDDVRRVFDGTLFYEKVQEWKSSQKAM